MKLKKISDINILLALDYNNHNKNYSWIANNIPKPLNENRYEYLRHDAPFYCLSSLDVMLRYYRTQNDFSDFIDEMAIKLAGTDVPNYNLSQLVDLIIYQTLDCIEKEKSDKTDLENVGWWMGRAAYITCIFSINFNCQYEKLFMESWKKYFTIETLDKH